VATKRGAAARLTSMGEVDPMDKVDPKIAKCRVSIGPTLSTMSTPSATPLPSIRRFAHTPTRSCALLAPGF
jgi:hypothetical protein